MELLLENPITPEEWQAADNMIMEARFSPEPQSFLSQAKELRVLLTRAEANILQREEHDTHCKMMSSTMMEPVLKHLPEMTTEELKNYFEYSETCSCMQCYITGFILYLKKSCSDHEAGHYMAKGELFAEQKKNLLLTINLENARVIIYSLLGTGVIGFCVALFMHVHSVVK